MKTRKTRIVALVLAVCFSGTVQAALQGRDLNGSIDSFEAYYDTDLNITWLADANYAKTSGHDDNGQMTWADANTWVSNLRFTDGVNVFENWRLPSTLQPDASCRAQSSGASFGYDCTDSELGHLFYSELGGLVGLSIWLSSDPDLDKFTNIQSHVYWSGSQNVAVTDQAWSFYMNDGFQYTEHKVDSHYAWAVHDGDVAAVPEPETYAMMLAGLLFIGLAKRHNNKTIVRKTP